MRRSPIAPFNIYDHVVGPRHIVPAISGRRESGRREKERRQRRRRKDEAKKRKFGIGEEEEEEEEEKEGPEDVFPNSTNPHPDIRG